MAPPDLFLHACWMTGDRVCGAAYLGWTRGRQVKDAGMVPVEWQPQDGLHSGWVEEGQVSVAVPGHGAHVHIRKTRAGQCQGHPLAVIHVGHPAGKDEHVDRGGVWCGCDGHHEDHSVPIWTVQMAHRIVCTPAFKCAKSLTYKILLAIKAWRACTTKLIFYTTIDIRLFLAAKLYLYLCRIGVVIRNIL